MVDGEGWVLSGNLRVGDHLTQRDGGASTVTAIEVRPGAQTVYNFEVAGDHNYYITDAQLLVHNCPVGAAPGSEQSITFGHGARRLEGTGLAQAEVEGIIGQRVTSSVQNASSTGSFWGRVDIRGTVIEYRAHTLDNGTINIGTYYVP